MNAQNPESRTGSDTPETDYFFMTEDIDWDSEVDFTRKLERERDKFKFDLEFRLEQNNVQQLQLSELRKQLAGAISACHIWQNGHSHYDSTIEARTLELES